MIFGTDFPNSLNATKPPSSFPCESPLTETANDASILDAPDIEGPSKRTGGNVVTRLVECHGIHRLEHGKMGRCAQEKQFFSPTYTFQTFHSRILCWYLPAFCLSLSLPLFSAFSPYSFTVGTFGCLVSVATLFPTSTSHSLTVLSKEALEGEAGVCM